MRFQYPDPFEPTEGDKRYIELLRKMYNPDLGKPATLEDFDDIKSIMLDVFDANNGEILSDAELEEAIDSGSAWIYSENGKICTIYIYQIFGKKRYGAMTYNRLSADYLYSLCRNANRDSRQKYDIRFHYGWINASNNNIIRSMNKQGLLILDGTKNYIYERRSK